MRPNPALTQTGCIEYFVDNGKCYALESGMVFEVKPGTVYYLKALELAVTHPDYRNLKKRYAAGNDLVFGFIREYMGNFNSIPDVFEGIMTGCSGFTKVAIKGRMISSRERDIITLMSQGKADKEIANALGIALTTVTTILRNIRRKIGATSKYHIVAMAAKTGML